MRPAPSRYPRLMRSAALLITALWLAASAAAGASSSQIVEETARSYRSGMRVVHLWWLPLEYWVSSAGELGRSPTEVEEVRRLFRNYTLIAALDVEVRPDGGLDARSTAEIVRRIEIEVGGERVEVLKRVDPRLQELAPDLTYVLQTSLAAVGSALHVLPLPNVDASGRPILLGSEPGRLRARYRVAPKDESAEFWWHAPLTAIAGAGRCPDGALSEASWTHCPWGGAELR